MKHRVLHVITPSRLAGAETLLLRMAPRLREQGHTIAVVCNRAPGNFHETLQQAGIEVCVAPVGGKANVRALFALWRVARRQGAELSHTHLSSASWWAGWLDRFHRLPSVGHVHGFTSALWHRHQRRLIAVSQAVGDDLTRQGIPASRIDVLPNPVSPGDVRVRRDAAAVRRELGADDNTFVIGTFAHLSLKKGWHDLLNAVPQVLQRQPRAQFWCAGDGPLRAELEAQANSGGYAANVRFLGFRRDVPDLMNAIDVMALPSHREPFGLVYVEAALLGKPSVGCSAGGAVEVIAPGETGLLVPPRDATALANALVELASDVNATRRMGELARVAALERFGWEKFLPELERIYDATVKN